MAKSPPARMVPVAIDWTTRTPSKADHAEPRPPNRLVPPMTAAAIAVSASSTVPYGALLTNYGISMAGALLASLPTLLVYILLGRYFIGGLMSGSVKG